MYYADLLVVVALIVNLRFMAAYVHLHVVDVLPQAHQLRQYYYNNYVWYILLNKVVHCVCILISAEAVKGNLTGFTLRMLPSRVVTVGLTLSLAVSYTIFVPTKLANHNT